MGVFHKTRFILIALLISSVFNSAYAGDGKSRSLNKNSSTPAYTLFNINNISTYIYNNGEADINLQGNSGLEYPKGSGKAVMFESGVMWGGKVNNEIRAGGSFYNSMLVPGRKLPGSAKDEKYADRIFRVKREYKKGDFSSEIASGEGTASDIKLKYEKDWNEWPAEDGAPYEDKNNNGKYDPETDLPGVPGADQTIWFIANEPDDSLNLKMLGSKSLGIEMQVTVWGYKNNGSLDNMLFKSYRLINKSGNKIDSMFFSIPADPDLGDAGDDFSGCDSLLNLGYIFNSDDYDLVYKYKPPAAGFTILRGPRVKGLPSDTARFMGRKIAGYKNLSMTAFRWGFKSSSIEGEVSFSGNFNSGALRYFHTAQGLTNAGLPWLLPASLGGGPTKFLFSGDPVAGTGFLEKLISNASDKRIGLHTGPFEIAPGDTQEVIFAEIAAGGPNTACNNLQAVSLLKEYSKTASLAYNTEFKIPSAPPEPAVLKCESDRQIILDWGNDPQSVSAIENYNVAGYLFEGYNIYQLPRAGSALNEGKRIATFDKINGIKSVIDNAVDSVSGDVVSRVYHYGTDSGIKRYIKIDRDTLTDSRLANGKYYYYAVTAYCVSKESTFGSRSYESHPLFITAVPHSPDPGIRYSGSIGDTLKAVRVSGTSDGKIVPLVIDPDKLNGHTYRVSYDITNGFPAWKVTDLTLNQVKISGQTNESGDEAYLTVDGILIKVTGPVPGIKQNDMYNSDDKTTWGWDIPSGTRKWSWSYANISGYPLETFLLSPGSSSCIGGAEWWNSSKGKKDYKNILIKFAQTDTAGNTPNSADPNISYAYRYLRMCNNPPAKPEFANFIVRTSASYDFQDFKRNFPFAAYDTETNPARRLAVGYLENNVVNGKVNGKYWPPSIANIDVSYGNSAASGPMEWFFIFDKDYSETPDPALTKNIFDHSNPLPIMYIGMPNMKAASSFSAGDQFAIYVNHPNSENDIWEFTAPAVVKDINAEKEDVEKINVFPNPYYGVNPQEQNKYQRFVTFNHLPGNAVIRIFNLAGELVRTIRKASPGQFEKWDLLTEGGYQAGSGLYIVHIDMPELGKSKVLKLAVIQEQIIPDHF